MTTAAPSRTTRPEVRAAARIVVAVTAVSALGGVVWGLLVPAERFLVTSRGAASLTGESMHRFDAVALMLCVGLVIGVLSAVAAWMWRSVRGPVVFGGLLIGSVVGAATTALVGLGIANLRFPALDTVEVGQIVSATPGIDTPLALIMQPLVAAMAYLAMASLNPSDDLGVGQAAAPVVEPADPHDRPLPR
ncbi:DUF2567 domain-containing protein [Rhodococcus kronopolitis]|uniref:DUF2567 domain-containing protein n=1 Tax=Rhodococcus kronopolitis TaxID=1460226 RepID=A0ABV9FWM8_9NOCA